MAWTDHLPSWASVDKLGRIAIDADVAYPKMFAAMEAADPELGGEITLEKLTLARYMVTRKVKKVMYDNGGEPPVRLHIVSPGNKWRKNDYHSGGVNITAKKGRVYKACGIYNIRTKPEIDID